MAVAQCIAYNSIGRAEIHSSRIKPIIGFVIGTARHVQGFGGDGLNAQYLNGVAKSDPYQIGSAGGAHFVCSNVGKTCRRSL